jgi:hypothetical protein
MEASQGKLEVWHEVSNVVVPLYVEPFPYLSNLLAGYFHQDAYDFDGTDEGIMLDYRRSSWDYQRLGTRADIRRLLHQHGDHLLQAIQQALAPSLIIGETDDEARAWLMKIDRLLDDTKTETECVVRDAEDLSRQGQ